MTFGEILYMLFLQPLQILFEVVFGLSVEIISNIGISIIVLSITMNLLVLPLYKHTDKMQSDERDIQEKLRNGVQHIKKSFKGEERIMTLQTYYRQNNYRPAYALRSASSLLLQIPFFITAYRFLSNLESLHNVSFGLLSDLSKPDALITIMGHSINLLPFIMTIINIVSSVLYSKGHQKKDKVQLYITALVFLVLLYNSPSGLVFYWTLNNAFSLLKNIINKTNDKKKVIAYLLSIVGIVSLIIGLIKRSSISNPNGFYILICFTVLCQYPLIMNRFSIGENVKHKRLLKNNNHAHNRMIYILGCIYMTVLTGAVIPTYVINASPQEFLYINHYNNPLWYVLASLCLSTGTFIIWLGVFYTLSPESRKAKFDIGIWILCGISTLDYMFFGDWGTLSSSLTYVDDIYMFSRVSKTLIPNTLLLIAVFILFRLIYDKKNKFVTGSLIVCTIALSIMSVYNGININSSVSKYNDVKTDTNVHISLNKNNKNVVFIMIDKAMGEYVPYMFNEKPELKEQFDGFTYYSNTISYGLATNFASPALFGGYEYTPTEMNSRNNLSLEEKHNEALKIMPVLFSNNNYDVTVCNPKYAGYQFIPDLSIYDKYPNISAYNTNNVYPEEKVKEFIKRNNRNFFLYSIARIAPVFLQPIINDQGRYFLSNDSQIINNENVANGNSHYFINCYNELKTLSEKTVIDSTNDKGYFFFMTNDMAHDYQMLQEPEYEPKKHVDNTEYNKNNKGRFTLNNKTLNITDSNSMAQYQSNMAAMIQLGKWFDYLREEGVYDNTKIIVASDHGFRSSQMKNLIANVDGTDIDLENFFPLLMVKDFNSKGFTTSDEFMTNADVPTIAFKDVINNPINPFTKKPINSSEKYAHSQFILDSMEHSITTNSGNTYKADRWLSVHDSIWDKNNWKKLADKDVLDTEKAKQLDEQKK